STGEPDRGEDQPDLATRQHAEPDEQLVARRPDGPHPRAQLPHHWHDEEDRGVAQHGETAETRDVDVDADLEEEHRDEEVADRRELAANPVALRAASDREPG